MSWYSLGTVSVAFNSEVVSGKSTDFVSNVRTGDAFRGPDGRWYEITNVTSATVISIKPNYQGATASGQVYAVVPIHGYSKNLADQFREINNQWGATLAGIKPWAVSSTGQQAQADMGISAVGRALNNASTPANALSYLGGVAPNQMGWAGNAMNTADLDSLTVSGLYAHGTAVPSPVNNAQGYVLHMQHGNPDFAVQQWYQLNSATGQYMRIKAGGNWSRWVLQYSQFNLVGLASFDASNNPSGAIIQRGGTVGFNEYVRYADGTQICWGNTTTNVGATMAYQPAGTLSFYITPVAYSWGFPVSFSRPPSVMVNPMRAAGNNASRPWGSTMSVTETLFSWYGYDTASVASGMAASYVAMGRWN